MAKKKIKIENTSTFDSIDYSGSVSISKRYKNGLVKNIQVKNTGSLLLFNGIAKFLVDDSLDSIKPRFLGIGHEAQPSAELPSRLDGEYVGKRVLLTNKHIQADIAGYKAIFTGLVTYSWITNNPITELGLFNQGGNSESLLAKIILDPQAPIILNPGEDLIIDWSILIQNKPSGTI